MSLLIIVISGVLTLTTKAAVIPTIHYDLIVFTSSKDLRRTRKPKMLQRWCSSTTAKSLTLSSYYKFIEFYKLLAAKVWLYRIQFVFYDSTIYDRCWMKREVKQITSHLVWLLTVQSFWKLLLSFFVLKCSVFHFLVV